MNIYGVEIKRLYKSFLIWTIVLSLLLCLFLAFFPSMANSDMAEIIKAKLDAIPPAMRNVVGIDKFMDFSDFSQYLAYVLQFIFIGACIYALILGVSALIKEESEGTIEFLYSKPTSRIQIVTFKLAATFTLLLLMNLILYIVCIVFGELFVNSTYKYLNKLTFMFKYMFATQMMFYSIGFFASTLLRKYSQAMPFALGIFFISYLFGTFSSIIPDLNWLEYLSPYHYSTPITVLKSGGGMDAGKSTIMLFVIAALLVLTFVRYNRKDLIL